MDCRRRLRLGSGAAVVVAAALVAGSHIQAASEPSAQFIFESRPQVEPLRCPSQASASSRTSTAPKDRIPAADELSAAAIDAGRTLASPPAPRLDADVLRGFVLPASGAGPLRVAVWGDSHVAAGFITDELARHVEAKGLAATTRIIPASAGRPGVRLPVRQVCKGGEWQYQAAYMAPAPVQVGPSLSNLRSTKVGDYLWLDLRQRADRHVRSVRIHYLPVRSAGALGVRIDDGPEVRFELSRLGDQQRIAPGVLDLRASSSISTLKLRVLNGEVVLQSVTLDYVSPADVTIDVFGLPSATINGWASADAAYLRKSIDGGSYDAIVLEYGTNEGAVGRFDAPKYAAMLSSSLKNMRAVFPDSACVLMGPTDRGVRVPEGSRRGSIDFLKYSRIHQQIARIQGEVGAKFGCALWDWQRAMGGTGSIYAWARATPPLAAPDLIHLTLAGYRRSAAALAQSLSWSETR